jgi:hypothetical protein
MVKKSQKLYRMKGCSNKNKNKNKNKKKRTRKHLGGANLAYPTNNIFFQKPPLAYTSKTGGGTSAAYPSTGASARSQTWLNSSNLQGGGGNGLPYPNGLTGQPWGGNLQWPGTTNIGGNNNHYSLNTYAPHDVSRQIMAAGANPPFSGVIKGGGRRKQKGGGLSNFLFQDLVNVGRLGQFGLGSTYNTLKGFEPSSNPLPWKGQLDVRSRI